MKIFDYFSHTVFMMFLLSFYLSSTSAYATGWLATSGNHIINSDGSVWAGRGANLHDTRSCGGGMLEDGTPINDNPAGVMEVKRRIDVLTDQWHANFIRLVLQSRREVDNYLNDSNYRSIINEVVSYTGTKPGVYVLISIWDDPSLEKEGELLAGSPTKSTNKILAQLAKDFYSSPHVLYGVSNEPENNFDGSQDEAVWQRMNDAVQAIRTAEDEKSAENGHSSPNRHIVTVQGTRNWATDLSYYAEGRTISAGGGVNVAYETHTFNSPSDFASVLLLNPSPPIPVILGEFGPGDDKFHTAKLSDMQTLIDMAKANNISFLAWSFHQYCPPNLIADTPGVTSYANSTTSNWRGMPIFPTDFGQLLIKNLFPTSQVDCLLNWAEETYPSLFIPATTSITLKPWYYRYYSHTGSYLGASIADNHLYYLGPDSSYTLFDAGELSTWLTKSGCR